MKLKVTEIQRFCMHDGPGIHTTVFLKGCPLRCRWCHNPETQKREPELLFYPNKCIFCKACEASCSQDAHTAGEIHSLDREKCVRCFRCAENCPAGALEVCGKDMSVEEILSIVQKDSAFYGTAGGMTLSGGEPFLQKEGAVALLKACKRCGISTAVETCGYADPEVLRAAAAYVDLFLWDLKDTDEVRHRSYTGVSNRRILENLSMVDKLGGKIRLRCILVNGVNTNAEHYRRVADIAKGLHHLEGVEYIPYHAYGGTKATFLGMEENGRADWIPDAYQMECAKAALAEEGIVAF